MKIFEEKEYFTTLMNKILLLKKKGIIIIRIGSRDKKYDLHASLADMIIRIDTVTKNGKLSREIYVWKTECVPAVLSKEDYSHCIHEVMEKICQVVRKRNIKQ
ncbi:MAG: hypothetical protein J7J82_08100 [Staphylothermus sp.]|nr:hypothetical protein [Staphylothermus sp.]